MGNKGRKIHQEFRDSLRLYARVMGLVAFIIFLLQILVQWNMESIICVLAQAILYPVLLLIGGTIAVKIIDKKQKGYEEGRYLKVTEYERTAILTAICVIFIIETFAAAWFINISYAPCCGFFIAFLLGGFGWDSFDWKKLKRVLRIGRSLLLFSVFVGGVAYMILYAFKCNSVF